MRGLREVWSDRFEAVTERLDRLIAVTMKSRTADVGRLEDIERRLTRLEERPEK
jgi:hypothetical protein